MQTSVFTFNRKLDNVVGFKSKRGYAVRKLITPTNPNTEKQVAVRARFKALSVVANDLNNIITPLYTYASRNKMSLRNAFVKLNYPVVQTVDPASEGAINTEKLDYNKLQLTNGSFPGVVFGRADFNTPQLVTVTFEDMPGVAPDDIVVLAAYIPGLNLTVTEKVKASTHTVAMPLPAAASGETIQLWGYTQHFNTEQARVDYEASFKNDGVIVDALARNSAMNSKFSHTTYLGNGVIG